ncbi:Uncharacterised protein [Bordetella pertussis]|nr:Uncharacterised protein [Bordetella pertussis]
MASHRIASMTSNTLLTGAGREFLIFVKPRLVP